MKKSLGEDLCEQEDISFIVVEMLPMKL